MIFKLKYCELLIAILTWTLIEVIPELSSITEPLNPKEIHSKIPLCRQSNYIVVIVIVIV